MHKINKFNNSINTICILSALLVLALCYWARVGLDPYVTGINYISLFALAATIFILPDFLCYFFPSENKWYQTSEFYTGFLILFLGTTGVMLPASAGWISFIIIPIGIALAIWQFSQFIHNQRFLILFSGVAFMAYMILIFYQQDCNSLLFPEKIILGQAHIDTLFHVSMSNMFSTLGWTSTGLNGSPYIPYHWGSHAIIGGLRNWTGLSTLMFYNIAYTAIFLPLFFKSLFNFSNRFLIFKRMKSLNILFAITLMLVIYSSIPFRIFEGAMPISSESYCFSFIFIFLFASTLFSYISNPDKNINLFVSYSLFTIIVICFLKISVGFGCFIAVSYLYLRINYNYKSLLRIFIAGLIVSTLIYLFVYQTNYASDLSISLIKRILIFWSLAQGSFITYLLGAFIVMISLLKNNSLNNLHEVKSLFKSRKYIDLEILLVLTLTAILAGVYASKAESWVLYFCTVQLFISFPYIIVIAQKNFERFHASEKAKALFLILTIVICLISRPDVVRRGYNEITVLRANMLGLTQQQKVLKSFIADLLSLEKESANKTRCIYIPQTEKWYYESQSFRPFGSPFIVPAIAGIAMIGGVPATILKSTFAEDGYYYYKADGQKMAGNLIEAKNAALQKGYRELIGYQLIDSILCKQTFILR